MTTTLGRWLLVALAILGVAILTPAVAAHGTGPAATDGAPYASPNDGNATDWATWMEARMTEYMGPGAVEWMEAHMGTTVDEMGRYVADGEGPYGHGAGMDGTGTEMYGPGTGMGGQGGC